MKKILTVLASAAALALAPSVAQAQLHWNLLGDFEVTGSPMPTGAVQFNDAGGGYTATFTLVNFNGNTRTFTDWLVWCIDPNRPVTIGGEYGPPEFPAYKAYDLVAFDTAGLGSKGGYDVSLGDLNAMASLVDEVTDSYSLWGAPQRRTWNDGIWSRFEGIVPAGEAPFTAQYGNEQFNGREFHVLYNGRNQTFMFEVPEPGVFFLFAVGASLLAFVALRRRGTV